MFIILMKFSCCVWLGFLCVSQPQADPASLFTRKDSYNLK